MATLNLDKNAIRIIKDLVEKYPAGPRGSLNKRHYKVEQQWVDLYRRTTGVSVIREEVGAGIVRPDWKPFFGYDPVDLFKLGLNEEDDARKAIAFVFPESTRMTRNRDARRLYIRTTVARTWVRKNGTTGLWHASYRGAEYGTPLYFGITFHASSAAEVEARMAMVGPMLGADPSWRPSVSFDTLGSPEEAMAKNSTTIEAYTRRQRDAVARIEKELAEARKRLDFATTEAGKLMGAVMLGATDMDDEEEAAAAV